MEIKTKKIFYVIPILFGIVLLLLFAFPSKNATGKYSSLLFVSPYTNSLYVLDPKLDKIVGSVQLSNTTSQIMVKKFIRYLDFIYLVTQNKILLLDLNGTIKKEVETDYAIMGSEFNGGKLYVLGILKVNGSCNSPEAYKTYLSVYDTNLTALSKFEFERKRFDGFTILNGNIYASSFLDSKIYEISNGNIIKEISLANNSFPLQMLNFEDKEVIAIGRKDIFLITPDLSSAIGLTNGSMCNYFVKGAFYKNFLYTTCFLGNKTVVFDLTQRKAVGEINTTLPFYVLVYGDKVYVTSSFAKKIFVINPLTNTVLTEINTDQPPREMG